jgi:hypothetical protein
MTKPDPNAEPRFISHSFGDVTCKRPKRCRWPECVCPALTASQQGPVLRLDYATTDEANRAFLDLTPVRAPPPTPIPDDGGERFRCAARHSLPEPQDCDWPQCGCDPVATRVLEYIQESGFKIVRDDGGEGDEGLVERLKSARRWIDIRLPLRDDDAATALATLEEAASALQTAIAARLQAEGRVKELEEGLRPFADAADKQDERKDGEQFAMWHLRMHHLRKARSLLSSKEG